MRHARLLAGRRQTIAPRRAAPDERPPSARSPRSTLHGDLPSAPRDWRELELGAGAYQTFAFAAAGRDAFGQGVALRSSSRATTPAGRSPCCALRRGRSVRCWSRGSSAGPGRTITWACFVPASLGARTTSRALLGEAARQAGGRPVRLLAPAPRWEGVDNPLALLPGRRAPTPPSRHGLPRRTPHGSTRIFRAPRRRSCARRRASSRRSATVAHRRAASPRRPPRSSTPSSRTRRRRRRRAARRTFLPGRRSPICCAGSRQGRAPAMEMHALLAGERIVATFGALPRRPRLSGLIISYDGAPEIAAGSPGE